MSDVDSLLIASLAAAELRMILGVEDDFAPKYEKILGNLVFEKFITLSRQNVLVDWLQHYCNAFGPNLDFLRMMVSPSPISHWVAGQWPLADVGNSTTSAQALAPM